ncbi:hypothetical protein SELMODRAFT_136874 [Selaginella moellendorffii]|uniref:Strictosidine synthase conserved region domain-containing protein n=1 Tax=Selaginella moellendorffii TaxID=88036 RepID=D8TCK9_SELML|nr:hypothetical protein SELMODRAFT_136874 [Selaginella moellendorffii]
MGFLLVAILAVIIGIAASVIWTAIVRRAGIDPLPSDWPPTPKREGLFAVNTVLQQAEVIGVGELPGPEDISLDDDNGVLYTGCSDGWIKRVSRKTGEVENWVNVGGPTLGVVRGQQKNLLVCVPGRGLLNITRDKRVEVLSSEADGVKFMVANGLDVAKDGTIYFTDATSKFPLEKAKLDVLQCRPNGRLLKYDPATRTTTVLRKNMFFANGVSLSAKEDFLVVSETSMCMKYWLKGKKAGTMEVFMDNLLGQPDNVKRDGHGGFWIALVSGRTWLSDMILKIPALKYIIAQPEVLDKFFGNARMAKVLRVSEDGRPLAFYEDPTGKVVGFVTTGLEVGDYLYLGSLERKFIGGLNLQELQVT